MMSFIKSGPDGMPELDFGAMASEAKARFASPAPATEPVTPTADPTPAPEPDGQLSQVTPPAQPSPTPSSIQPTLGDPPPASAQPTEQEIFEIPDDKFVKLIVNGEAVVMKGADAKKQMMLHASYTRKTQELAAERRRIEPFLQAVGNDPATATQVLEAARRAAQLEQILTNPQLTARYLRETGHPALQLLQQAAPPPAPAPPAPGQPQGYNPDELASLGDIEQRVTPKFQTLEQKLAAVEQRFAQAEQQFGQFVDQRLIQLEDARVAQQIRGELDGSFQEAVKQNPILSIFPNAARDMREDVMKMQPRTKQELFEAANTVLQGYVENANRVIDAHYKQEALRRQQILAQGIEPTTGTQHTVQPTTSYLDPKSGKFDFGRFRQAVKASVR